MRRIEFDGVEITSEYTVSDLERTGFSSSVNALDTGSGSKALVGASQQPPKISFIIWKRGWLPKERQREAVRSIMALLAVDSYRPLSISDDDGLYYMAIPEGEHEVIETLNAVGVRASFTARDPFLYGAEQTVVVPSGGSVTFNVGGTCPTFPVIEANATRFPISGSWGLMLDDGDFLYVKTGRDAPTPVVADCANRTLVVNGSAALPTLPSDWLEFAPGVHTLEMTNGSGAATVKFVERWYA